MPQKRTPSSQKTAKQRLEEKRLKMRSQERSDGQPVQNPDKLAQLEKSFEDDWEEKSKTSRSRRLVFSLTRLSIADMYLSGYSVEEIAEHLTYSEAHVTQQIRTVQTAINSRMLALSENLVLVQLARTEQLMKKYYPLALDVDDKAFDRVVRLMQLQLDLQKSVVMPEDDGQMNKLEKFQRTITTNSHLYDIVQANIDDGWVKDSTMTVDDLFAKVQEFGSLDPLKDQISRLEEAAATKVAPDETTEPQRDTEGGGDGLRSEDGLDSPLVDDRPDSRKVAD